jgi:single-strand DNA-binding protein
MLSSLNSVLIEGNLVQDPQIRSLETGSKLCHFSVASNRYFVQENQRKTEVSFFDVEVWNKTAEQCATALSKGRGVRIVGRLKQDRWTDNEGKSHSKVKIIGDSVDFKPKFNKKAEESTAEDATPVF